MASKSGQIRELKVIAISSDTTVADFAHHGTLLDVTATSAIVTITLPAAATMPNGFTVTIRRNAASTKNVAVAGGATATLTESDTLAVYTTDSSAWIQTGSTIGILNNVHINHGFQNSTDSSITFTATSPTRTVSVAPASSTFVYWREGTKVTKSTAQTATITDTVGMWFVYFNSSDVLTTSQVFPGFLSDSVYVCMLYWNGTDARRTEERHGYLQNRPMHKWAHDTIGTRYESGLIGTFTDTTLAFTEGYIHDEDIEFYIGAQTNCVVWYLVAATGKMTFTDATTPYLESGGALQYDNAGTPTAVGVAKYVVNDVYASTDLARPIYVRVGTAEYSTLAAARAAPQATWANIVSAELKLLYRVIYQNTGGSPDFVESSDFRTSGSVPAGGTPSISPHASTHAGTGSDPITALGAVTFSGTAPTTIGNSQTSIGGGGIITMGPTGYGPLNFQGIGANDGAFTVNAFSYTDGYWRAITTGAAEFLRLNGGYLQYYNAPSVSANADLTFVRRFAISDTGVVTADNLAGTGNRIVTADANGAFTISAATLTSTNFWVGNGSNVAAAVAMSGDATMANTGAVTIANSAVTNAKMANMNAHTFKGNNTAGAAAPIDLTIAQMQAELAGTSPVGSTLAATNIWVGNASNQAAAVTASGDLTISNAGVFTISALAVTAAKTANITAGSITGTATVAATDRGKSMVCTGTTSDYTVTLLPTGADFTAGDEIEFRMASALTKLVTLDAGVGGTIDGVRTRIMWADEVARLRYLGSQVWVKVSGKTIPMSSKIYQNSAQTINASSVTTVDYDSSRYNNGMTQTLASDRITVTRPGKYIVYWIIQLASGQTANRFLFRGYRFDSGDNVIDISYFEMGVPNTSMTPGAQIIDTCAAVVGDYFAATVYHDSAGSRLVGVGYDQCSMAVQEIPTW